MKRYLIAGMSHVESLRRGWEALREDYPDTDVEVVNMRIYRNPSGQRGPNGIYIDSAEIADDFKKRALGKDAVVLSIAGNEHNIYGLAEIEPLEPATRIVSNGVLRSMNRWLAALRPAITCPLYVLTPPPPIESEARILAKPGEFAEKLAKYTVRKSADRLALWARQCEITERVARQNDVPILRPPASAFSESGFLAPRCCGADPTHGNVNYGRLVVGHVIGQLARDMPEGNRNTNHPYKGLQPQSYWRNAMEHVSGHEIDPVVAPRFRLQPLDKVATAGSCFAQHISKRLRNGGFQYLVTEPFLAGDEVTTSGEAAYDFSARYGNVYTARQLVQLFDRAFGYYRPTEPMWERPGGGYCDPFRPRIRTDGFQTEDAALHDRHAHLISVRKMFCELDVFIFTLGLTECWVSKLDGAAFPVAPGVAGGSYDPGRHAFVNFDVAEVRADMSHFVDRLRQVNPSARVLFTVSPVPLAATRTGDHVLVSTTYSKSVLRAAVGEIVTMYPHVDYFPSYEIITGPHAGGKYFAEDRRSVTKAGVDHVMRVFMARMTEGAGDPGSATSERNKADAYAGMEAAADAACDEELYARDA